MVEELSENDWPKVSEVIKNVVAMKIYNCNYFLIEYISCG